MLFRSPDKGQVIFEGRDITNLPPNKRNLNTVFQKYALFPHMTIAENIAFGLKISGKSKSYINDKIKYALKLVNLDGFENRMPDSLSGKIFRNHGGLHNRVNYQIFLEPFTLHEYAAHDPMVCERT